MKILKRTKFKINFNTLMSPFQVTKNKFYAFISEAICNQEIIGDTIKSLR